MSDEKHRERESWKTFAAIAALVAPLFAVLWLGVTLTTDCGSFTLAVVKIVFAILVVGTGITGIRWMTASGLTLLVEALLVVLWVALRIESYPPNGALRTLTILAVPTALSGILFVLAGGMKAGTWPPARFRSAV